MKKAPWETRGPSAFRGGVRGGGVLRRVGDVGFTSPSSLVNQTPFGFTNGAPLASELMGRLARFERFMHDGAPPLPPLIKAGLLHVQFESIHCVGTASRR